MDRRFFINTITSAMAMSAVPTWAVDFSSMRKRVGLIGSGWYGKSALLRMIQVAPVNVVAICDVDTQMMSAAADLIATRQESGEKPRTYTDYKKMLSEEDLDIVQVSTPDHQHALPMIHAVQAGADVYVEKPISVDVIEGQAMYAAAKKYNKVIQVNTQRRSTPHLIDAKKNIIDKGLLGDIGMVEICCYYHMRARGNPPVETPPAYFDYDAWCGPAPMIPYTRQVHPRGWRAFQEYSNGIVGDMCIHMYDMVRWMLDLGWPNRISSSGGIFVDTESIATTTDTQTATFTHDDYDVKWTHRTWGSAPDPEYPWAAFIYGSKGTLKASVQKYDFIPRGGGAPIHNDVVMELDQYPEDRDEEGLEKHVAPAIRGHMKDFLTCVETREQPVANIEQGYISSTSCILANVAMETGETLQYNPETGRTDSEKANALLARPYRQGYTHPTPDDV